MKISANEIASTELLGMLDGQEIKLVRTKGGLNLAIGRDRKGVESVLAAASHPAILSYNMEKNHPSFHSALLKGERAEPSTADKHSHFLTDDLRKSGHDIYSIQDGSSIEFYVTQHDLKIGSVKGEIGKDDLQLKSYDPSLRSFKDSLASAVSEKALSCGIKKVKMS